jgi:hypothetical protein
LGHTWRRPPGKSIQSKVETSLLLTTPSGSHFRDFAYFQIPSLSEGNRTNARAIMVTSAATPGTTMYHGIDILSRCTGAGKVKYRFKSVVLANRKVLKSHFHVVNHQAFNGAPQTLCHQPALCNMSCPQSLEAVHPPFCLHNSYNLGFVGIILWPGGFPLY